VSDIAVIGGTTESRLVIRGLLRLHRHRVVYEGASFPGLAEVAEKAGPKILILDGRLDAETEPLLRQLVQQRPNLHVVLVTSQPAGAAGPKGRELGIAAVLPRPFTVSEFSRTIDRLASDLSPESAPSLPAVPA
jgi:DNA-binding NarL/FixJ family response regulator